MIPVLVISFYLNGKFANLLATFIFLFASITDYFDGFLARILEAHSHFGRILDPIADKLLVASALVMLIHFDRAPVIPTLLILCRELLVSGLREHLAEFKVSLPVTKLSKIKTAMQMIAIVILLLGEPVLGSHIWVMIGEIFIWVAAILTLITGYAYCREGFKHIN